MTGQSKGPLTEIRCTKEQHLTLKMRMKVHISHIRTKVKSVKSFQGEQRHTRKRRVEDFIRGEGQRRRRLVTSFAETPGWDCSLFQYFWNLKYFVQGRDFQYLKRRM